MNFALRKNEASYNEDEFYVVHPLFDKEEDKCNPDSLGPMQMTKTRKYSLLILRLYLILMVCLAIYRVLDYAGVFGRLIP
ncbi:MAG: hypothetical protein M1409_06100 [Actinobacteria bacterium]|nr:hypothetical protein [Actinomycetota bacterium]